MARKQLSQSQTTYSLPPYYGLPTFAPGTSSSAVVCGANGISGQAMLKILAANSARWPVIWALSRGSPVVGGVTAPHIRHVAVDFLEAGGVEALVRVLQREGLRAQVAFWFGYKDGGEAGVVFRENVSMLRNFVDAAYEAGAGLKRIVLQTGGKHYGVHLGPYQVPAKEDDPRVDLVPNFYYAQEDTLTELGPRYGFDWVVIRPMTIIGALKEMTSMALGLYLAVTKELGDEPIFNGTWEKYYSAEALSNSTMNAYFEEWCALDPKCSNEAFNTTNGDVVIWARLFPRLCTFFNLPLPPANQFSIPAPRPVSGHYPTVRPLDYAEHGKWELRNSLEVWAKEERTITAWTQLAKRERLDHEAFAKASWGYADRNMAILYNKLESLEKVRRFGFLAGVDSEEAVLEVMREAQGMGILPKYD